VVNSRFGDFCSALTVASESLTGIKLGVNGQAEFAPAENVNAEKKFATPRSRVCVAAGCRRHRRVFGALLGPREKLSLEGFRGKE
jgi:hypothetical protein